MINQKLLDCFESTTQFCKSINSILKERPNSGLTRQDVIDTKEEFKRRHPGACSQYTHKRKRLNGESQSSIHSKILVFDLETAPMVSYHWRRFKENISIDQTISESFIICFSAKWLYSSEVISFCCTPEEMRHQDDSRICNELWKLVDQAEALVAHNGNHADIPWMNSRFIINGLNPPSSYQSIDTLHIAQKKFGFSSNKLDALGTYFNKGNKIKTDFSLWRGCMEGDQQCLDDMVTYNRQDVVLLEDIYIALRPWAGTLNYRTSETSDGCPLCGHEPVVREKLDYITPCNRYAQFRCKSCGAVFHSRKPIETLKPLFVTSAH